jgi:hypothetical protein
MHVLTNVSQRINAFHLNPDRQVVVCFEGIEEKHDFAVVVGVVVIGYNCVILSQIQIHGEGIVPGQWDAVRMNVVFQDCDVLRGLSVEFLVVQVGFSDRPLFKS